MKRTLAILIACLFMIAVIAVMAIPAFAAIVEGLGKGNPETTGPGFGE